jgi:VIT1/CCC1 family predicted Fe2+/Mn2+ transporter
MLVRNLERHRTGHSGWLRAAVLGANDGILSTASLVLGVAAAHGSRSNVLVAGIAGLVGRGHVDGLRGVRVGPLAGRHGSGGP